jgi:hypothetical protein
LLIFFVGFVDWFRAFYLYCSPYNFWLLKAIAQSKVNLSVSLLSAKTLENDMEEISKELIQKR